ncbi:FAD-binding oxidoreductase [Yinghuangia soli]|uniref:FAD-binding oxidoreductase n=1 Tax=Yinghuangia soli TaxID=2908204 RepID=A0AA41Q5J0_9ACTN|nr:FAD-binding oxidoreductase [Yinghuangia soli]MCF2531938.1 FAD-binding oxidoreductase [Yinghuangia soli]
MTTLGLDAAQALRGAFRGDVLLPDAPGYDDARTLFNGSMDRHPGAIAQCTSREDVAAALAAAREMGMEVSVRGGGHGVAGKALTDGGLAIDLRRMNAVTVDPYARLVRIEGGGTMADLDGATQPCGLATTGGRASTTGIGGFTLGGGSGWLERKFGLACDNLTAVEMVTADGRMIEASETEHSELFWALHGGGGNFGIATSFTFKLYELPAFSMALMMWPPEYGPDVLRTYRDFCETAPDEVGGGFIYLVGPPEEFVPPHLVGRLACAVLITYAGTEAECRDAAAPFLGLAPDGAMIAELPYMMFQTMLDDPPGLRNYWSAEYMDSFPDAAVDAFCARSPGMVQPSASMNAFFPQGAAVATRAAGNPLAWTDARYGVHPFALWEDPADDAQAAQWAHQVCADMRPWSTGSTYLNFIGDEGQARIVDAFGPDNYRRMAAVKAEYDPDNVFHLNQNIPPM